MYLVDFSSYSHMFIAASVPILLLWRWYAKERFPHIRGPPSASFVTGNLLQMFNSNSWSYHAYLDKTFGSIVKFYALFNSEELLVSDPLALRHILVKDVAAFEEPRYFVITTRLVLGPSLASAYGERHLRYRKILNPLFSTRQIRVILPLLSPVADELRDVISRIVTNGPQVVDLLPWFSKSSLECTGRGGFDYSFGSLEDEENAAFSGLVSSLGTLFLRTMFLRSCLPYVEGIGTPAWRGKVLQYLPAPAAKEMANVVDTLHSKSAEIVAMRRAELAERGKDTGKRDLLSALLISMESSDEDRLTEEEVVANISNFIFGGVDTTSHLLCRIVHLLAKNPEWQTKLRAEIIAARLSDKYFTSNYDMLTSLPYLDATIRETTRVFPPVTHLPRVATQDTVLPLTWPLLSNDGKTEITNVPIKKGQNIMVSVLSVNHNTKIWGEDAELWKPERWIGTLKSSVAKVQVPGVYSSMMSFLGGPRSCIGFTFAELEMKLTVATLVESLIFEEGPPITWEWSGVVKPTVTNSSDAGAQLPLRISLKRSVQVD